MAALVNGRIAHRLISNFGFTVAQRSFDGALWRWSAGPNTVSGFVARPTAGVFQVGGMKELDIEVYYGSYNARSRPPAAPGLSGSSASDMPTTGPRC